MQRLCRRGSPLRPTPEAVRLIAPPPRARRSTEADGGPAQLQWGTCAYQAAGWERQQKPLARGLWLVHDPCRWLSAVQGPKAPATETTGCDTEPS